MAISPYKTAEIFGVAAPAHVPESAAEDLERIRAYDTYTGLYDNQMELFEELLASPEGAENFRRLSPVSRALVEATNRYLARGLSWVGHDPAPDGNALGSALEHAGAHGSEQVAIAMGALSQLFIREEFGAKFLSLKRWMLIRGDAMLHVTGDSTKPEGQRIRITELDPSTYFAIPDPADAERVVGCYIVNVIKDDEDEDIVARLEYQRILDEEMSAKFNGTAIGQIFVRLSFWTVKGWDDRDSEENLESAPAPARFGGERFAQLLAGMPLDSRITALPVYHFRNNRRGNRVYGVSELQGLETLIVGVNQTISDEEIAVAMQGLGIYWTDSGKALDANGQEVPWSISPASMLQVEEGRQVGRVQGINTVNPSQEHANLLKREAQETSGTPRITMGGMDAANPASGVALAIEMAPMVAKNEEKEEEITAKLIQFNYDLLTAWLPVFEGYTDNGARITPAFDNPIPVNREAEVKEIVDLVTSKIISAAYARELLHQRLGYVFLTDVGAEVAGEAQIQEDITGARMDQEIAAGAEVGVET